MAGLLLTPYAVTNVIGSRLSSGVRRRLRPELWLPLGCAVYCLASVQLLVAHENVWQLFAMMTVAGVASGLSFAQMPGLLVMSVPPHETGPAVGFSMVVRLLGFSVGSTIGGLLTSSRDSAYPSTAAFDRALLANLVWWVLTMLIAVLIGMRGRPRTHRAPRSAAP